MTRCRRRAQSPTETASRVSTFDSDPSLLVRLDSGLIHGADTGSARTFTGIPYARPPIGELRWSLPERVLPGGGVLDATKPGNLCPQQGAFAEFGSEDCLFVNVTTPLQNDSRQRPVMVWLHGGGYTRDGGGLYDAQRMAARGDVIVITVNYRLGVFGYFGLPGLEGSGNFGLADQIAALKWTQRNAAAFGGDPNNVTVFGQSAGAMSASALMTSPETHGLFHKMILQSGSAMLRWPTGFMFPGAPAHTPYIDLATAQDDGLALAQQVGSAGPDPIDCMRRLPADVLVEHTQDFANHLAYGTSILPLEPSTAIRTGHFHRVPVISGGTRDEMRPFIGGLAKTEPITTDSYFTLLSGSFGDKADQVAAQYPLASYQSPALAWATITTDASWAINTAEGHRLMARYVPVYAYEFAEPDAPNINGIEVAGLPMGAAHASELPYLFDLGGINIVEPHQQGIADTMVDYWTTFAHTSTPNGANTPSWPEYNDAESVMQLGIAPRHTTDGWSRHKGEFWQRLTDLG